MLPGQIFAYYNWGGTLDAILPRLTSRPVAVRYETPYSDLHAVDLLTTVDDLVQQRRLVPGQLLPLLRLMGVGAVVTGTDDDISRSGAIDPAAAAAVLAGQGLGAPDRSYGPVRQHPAASGDIDGRGRTPTGTSVRHLRRPGNRPRGSGRAGRRSSTEAPSRWRIWPRLGRYPRSVRSSMPAISARRR